MIAYDIGALLSLASVQSSVWACTVRRLEVVRAGTEVQCFSEESSVLSVELDIELACRVSDHRVKTLCFPGFCSVTKVFHRIPNSSSCLQHLRSHSASGQQALEATSIVVEWVHGSWTSVECDWRLLLRSRNQGDIVFLLGDRLKGKSVLSYSSKSVCLTSPKSTEPLYQLEPPSTVRLCKLTPMIEPMQVTLTH